MNTSQINQIFADTAYVRMGGSAEELKCAEYLKEKCAELTSEEKLVHFVEYFASIQGFGMKAYQGVYSSDSTPFSDKSVPALSFARIAPQNTATIHNSYDTAKVMSAEQMVKDIDFISTFVDTMANAGRCPVSKEIPENMKEKLDNYLGRKREKK